MDSSTSPILLVPTAGMDLNPAYPQPLMEAVMVIVCLIWMLLVWLNVLCSALSHHHW